VLIGVTGFGAPGALGPAAQAIANMPGPMQTQRRSHPSVTEGHSLSLSRTRGRLDSSPAFLEGIDEPVGGAVMRTNLFRAFEFWKDPIGKLLAKFNSPLVVAIDIPQNPLNEYLVLVKGYQSPKRAWRQSVKQEGRGWSISLEDLMRGNGVNSRPGTPAALSSVSTSLRVFPRMRASV